MPAELVNTTATVTTEELGERYGADSADATHVADVLGRYGLTVTEFQLASRRLKVSGMIAAMTAAPMRPVPITPTVRSRSSLPRMSLSL